MYSDSPLAMAVALPPSGFCLLLPGHFGVVPLFRLKRSMHYDHDARVARRRQQATSGCSTLPGLPVTHRNRLGDLPTASYFEIF